MSLAERLRDGISTIAGDVLGFTANVVSESLEKATKQYKGGSSALPTESSVSGDGPKSLLYDPFSTIDQLGFKDRPSSLTYYSLAEIVRRVPVLGAIHTTRINQVANFCQVPDDDREPGFRIAMRDLEKSPTRAAKKRMTDLEDFILHTGVSWYPGKDDFEVFTRKLVRDSLQYDQAVFEVEPDRRGLPANFYAVDSATFRIADVPVGADTDQDPDRTRFVQIYDEVVIAEFTANELCFGIRNPRTDIRTNGYGYSESEMLIDVLTALLWGFQYNKKFFSQGSVTKGILNFRGSIPEKHLQAFRRQFYSLITGINNAWRTPVVNAEDLQYVSMHTSNRDMEYAEWMNFLIKIACAINQMDPTEINFTFGNTGQSQSMFQSGTENRIKHSKDRGLRPILNSLARWLHNYVLWPIDPDFRIIFTGIDPKDVASESDNQKKRVSYLITVDEARAEEDLPPLPDGKGEVILDPTWLQFSQAKDMAEQGGMEGMEGDEDEMDGEIDDHFMGGTEQDESAAPAGNQYQQVEKSLRKAHVRRIDRPHITEYEIEL
jgi:hypothetical protein